MARIRTIKPEFFRSASMARVSVYARLTFEALWCHADDEGRYRYEPRLLKADAWPMDDDVSAKDVDSYVAELEREAVVCCYESGGKIYLHVVNWSEHQKISHATPSRLPECPKATHGPDHPREDSGKLRRNPEGSGTRARAQEVDLGSGPRNREVEGENTDVEFADGTDGHDVASPAARPVSVETLVFVKWQEATGKARAKLDAKRRRAIQRALKAYPLDDVLDAVQGWQHDPWTERPRHNDLTVLLRDADHIEKFRDLARDGPQPTGGNQPAWYAHARRRYAAALAAEGGEPS